MNFFKTKLRKIYLHLFIFFLLVALVISPVPQISFTKQAQAASTITIDGTSAAPDGITNNPTWQHTTKSATNTVLIVGVGGLGSATSVTYNGRALTPLANLNDVAVASLWYLKSPDVGTYTINVNGTTTNYGAGAITLSNVDLNNTFGTAATNTGTANSSNPNTSLTIPNTNSNQLVVEMLAVANGVGVTFTPLPGQTLGWINRSGSAQSRISAGSYAQAQPGSTTVGWNTNIPSSSWTEIGIPVNPAAAPTGAYKISGNVFNDTNGNGIKDGSETNYAGTPDIHISPSGGTVTNNTDGSYTITNLSAGTYTISLNTPPTGGRITSPVNGPPPSYQVTVGPNCNTNGAPGATCQ